MTYQPSLDVPALRNLIASKPLRKYEGLTLDVIDPELLVTFVLEGWKRDGKLLASLHPPINWSLPSRSLTFHLNAWEPISQLLAGFDRFKQQRYFEVAYAAALDWLNRFQDPALSALTSEQLDDLIGKREEFVWYDMGVGLRCYRIAFLLDVAARNAKTPDADIELLVSALYFHHEALSREKFFRSHNNHGLYQALGQLAAARRFSYLPEMAAYQSLAISRIRRLLDEHVFRSGVHKEHSPGYHYLILQALIGGQRAGLLDDPSVSKIIASMERALAWMVMPDGRLAPIGDTDPQLAQYSNRVSIPFADEQLTYLLSGGKFGTAPVPGLRAFMDAGYVFARLPAQSGQPPWEWSYLAQIAGFHSRAHKHADHLSFVWHDRGKPVLVDAGRYEYLGRTEPGSDLAKDGFWYSDPKRVFVESTSAHNTIQIDGRNLPRVGVEPFGSALVYAGKQGELVVSECYARYRETLRHRRVLVLLPGEFLVVFDAVEDRDGAAHDLIQRFTFAPSWEVADDVNGWDARHAEGDVVRVRSLVTGPTALRAIRGQTDPQWLGWCAEGPDNLVPASSVGFKLEPQSSAVFATLFAYGDNVSVAPTDQEFAVTLANASFVWDTGKEAVHLSIARDGNGVIQARLARKQMSG